MGVFGGHGDTKKQNTRMAANRIQAVKNRYDQHIMEWLNQNAGAVQALMTAGLIGVTLWYALTLRQQLVASFHPDIEINIIKKLQVHSGGESAWGTIVVTNKGTLPLKVVAVAMKLVYDENAFPDQKITIDAKHRVVSPDKAAEFLLKLSET
jgi:hypothetical protein